MATLNCKTLQTQSPRAELDKNMKDCNLSIVCIQDHFVHHDTDSDIVVINIGFVTLITVSD